MHRMFQKASTMEAVQAPSLASQRLPPGIRRPLGGRASDGRASPHPSHGIPRKNTEIGQSASRVCIIRMMRDFSVMKPTNQTRIKI